MVFGDLEGLTLKQVRQDLYRNVVTLRQSEDVFDDLSDEPEDWKAAIGLEMVFKPQYYQSAQPVIDRPFEEAALRDAIQFPFDHLGESRFSRGHFGVWYGSDSMDATIHETVYHWRNGFLADASYNDIEGVSVERRVHLVRCDAALINLLPQSEGWPELVSDDYSSCQMLGETIHKQGYPGVWTPSARLRGATTAAVFTPRVLSDPRVHCYLTYRLERGSVTVYRTPDQLYMTV